MTARPKKNLRRHIRKYLWPDASVETKFAFLVRAAATALALVAAVLSAFGIVSFSSDQFRTAALFVAGVLLLATLQDAADRREFEEQRWLAAAVHQVESGQIGPRLERLLAESTNWQFRGGSGRWLRSATLPALSRVRDREVPLLVQLLDPRDEHLCGECARYRASQRDAADLRPDEDDPRTIQADLLSSIYAIAWHSARSRINPEIVLLRSFSPLRYDIGTSGMFVTVAKRSEPALYASSGSWYFRSVTDELAQATHGHPIVVPPASTDVFPRTPSEVTSASVRAALEATRVRSTGTESPLLAHFATASHVDFEKVARHVFHVDEL